MHKAPIHFDVGSGGKDQEQTGPKMNRKQRREAAAKQRKDMKKLRKRLEARAKRRFAKMKQEQPEDPAEVAEQYSFG